MSDGLVLAWTQLNGGRVDDDTVVVSVEVLGLRASPPGALTSIKSVLLLTHVFLRFSASILLLSFDDVKDSPPLLTF